MVDTEIKQLLADHEFFSGLDEAALSFLAGEARGRDLDKNDVLFRYADPADHFYLLTSGRITLEVASIEGPPLELQELGPGELLGWSWLIPPYSMSFQARAVAPSTVIEFDGMAIRAHCDEDPAFGYALLKRFANLMSERVAYAREKMMAEWSPSGFA